MYPPPPAADQSGIGSKSKLQPWAFFERADKVRKRSGRGLALIASFALLAFSLGASIQQAAAQAAEL
ncbi:MAG: hypothetical protein OXF31_06670, partial [Gammaproteobacteria bacterium]|nr:hypothetical protein [Gammaproteobacteria bacterium]